jgi:hypothetical protein
MKVMVSAEVIERNCESTSYLLGLLECDDLFEINRYSDDGPPQAAIRETDRGGFVAPGWILYEPGSQGFGVAVTARGQGWRSSSVHAADVLRLAEGFASSVYPDLPLDEAKARARADATTACVARGLAQDLLVTERPFVLAPPFELTRAVAMLTPEDALPLVGLYLRTQREFIVDAGDAGFGTMRFNKGLFWWVATRDLLPSGWSWMSACAQESAATGDDQLTYLAMTLHQRVVRALEARDDVYLALLGPQNNDTADEALAALDNVLLMLMAAVDAAARVTHLTCSLGPDLHRSAWQSKQWRDRWRAQAPKLAALVDAGSHGESILTILRLFRNSVHGEALQPLAVSGVGRRREDTLVGVPVAQLTELQAALAATGGIAHWGVEQKIPGRFHADPGRLVDLIFPEVLTFLDQLLAATPVHLLPHVDISKVSTGPPADTLRKQPWDSRFRQRIRWQIGL